MARTSEQSRTSEKSVTSDNDDEETNTKKITTLLRCVRNFRSVMDKPTSTSTTVSLKRSHITDSESSVGTDSNSPPQKKRSSEEGLSYDSQDGGSSSNENDKSAISIDVPKIASIWKEDMYSSLKVAKDFDIYFNPYDIFGKKEERITRFDPKHRAKLECYQIVVKSLLDFEAVSIDDLNPHKIEKSYRKLKSLELSPDLQQWLEYTPTAPKTDLKEMCVRIEDRVQQFMSQLLYMVNTRKNKSKDSLSEGMFQELFTRYAKIFGLEVMSSPNIPVYELKIGDTTVAVEPDALVVDPALDNAVLAVIEVKKKYSRVKDQQTKRELRNTEISSDVKGQHLAQMLAFLPESFFSYSKKKLLYGFVVQGTEVTLTSFSTLNGGYLDDLKEGRLPREYCAEMKYSTSCNILSQQGRLGLLSSLVEMSVATLGCI